MTCSASCLHALMLQINDHMTFDEDPTNSGTSAAEAFGLKRGVCQDYAHIFIACARSAGVPARFVSGHFLRSDGNVNQQAGHAWAEAHVPGLGWGGFDAANGICTTDAHARVAIGLDYLGAAPVRGTRYGGGTETLTVAVKVDQAGRPRQWQSQPQRERASALAFFGFPPPLLSMPSVSGRDKPGGPAQTAAKRCRSSVRRRANCSAGGLSSRCAETTSPIRSVLMPGEFSGRQARSPFSISCRKPSRVKNDTPMFSMIASLSIWIELDCSFGLIALLKLAKAASTSAPFGSGPD